MSGLLKYEKLLSNKNRVVEVFDFLFEVIDGIILAGVSRIRSILARLFNSFIMPGRLKSIITC